MFVDEIKVYARAGHGGKGCVAFQREKYRPKGGPSGGNGGRGGDVILEGDHDLNNLIAQYYQPRLIAEDGEFGLGKGMDGHAGKDLVVKVPCGTLVWRSTSELVVDLTEHGQRFVLCKGGRGGLGMRRDAERQRQQEDGHARAQARDRASAAIARVGKADGRTHQPSSWCRST